MLEVQPTVVSLTDAAAAKLRDLTAEETNPAIGLRVYVYSGGCSGFRYGMMLEDAPTAEDKILEANGIKVYVDGKLGRPARGLPDRLRRHADGRRLHRQQPERGRGLRLRLQLPDRRRRRQRSRPAPTDRRLTAAARRPSPPAAAGIAGASVLGPCGGFESATEPARSRCIPTSARRPAARRRAR